MRKLLCPLLALAFLFGAVSIPASAAAPSDNGTQVVKADKKGKKKGKKKKGGKKKGAKKGKKKAATV
jgi:hypothetical protein